MSKKTPKPTTTPRKLSKKAITLITIPLLIFVILPLSIFAYIKFLDYQDAQKFQSLKADMLTLQTEFNKIMPGWEYEEGCKGGQEVFNSSRAQSCTVLLTNKVGVFDEPSREGLREAVAASDGRFTLESRRSYVYETVEQFELVYQHATKTGCILSGSVAISRNQQLIMGCTASARSFHFEQKN